MRDQDIQRFWSYAFPEPNSGCWLWEKAWDKDDYGLFKCEGKMLKAHRVAYELVHGPVPDGMCVCHRCDTPPCMNPDHLFLGTRGENNHDRNNKERQCRGEDCHKHKLTEGDVYTILRLSEKGLYLKDIAPQFAISAVMVGRIVRGKNWKHLPRTRSTTKSLL